MSDFTEQITTAEPAAELAARLAGVDAAGVYRLELSKLRKSGLLVQVNISGSSLFTRRASFGELGIGDQDVRRARYTTGAKFVFPREMAGKWRSIENRLRAALEYYALPLTGFAPFRWMPWTAMADFRARFEELHAEAEALKAELEENYADYMLALKVEFRESAENAWRAIESQGFDAVKVNGKIYDNMSAFSEAVVNWAFTRMPSITEIEEKLRISYQVSVVYGAEDVAADELRAAKIAEEESTLRAEYRAVRERESLKVQAERDVVNAERRRLDIETEKQEQLARAAITAELERAREQMATTSSYVDEIFQAVRTRLADGAREMLESIQHNHFLKGKVAQKGAGLLDLYNTLGGCIHNDYALENTLRQLREEIGPIGSARGETAPARDTEAITNTLEKIVELAENELADLTAASRADFIEL